VQACCSDAVLGLNVGRVQYRGTDPRVISFDTRALFGGRHRYTRARCV
jgi:hypothetical protein